MKKILLSLFIIFSLLIVPHATNAQEETKGVNISMFDRDDCQHCQDAKAFLTKLEEERDDLDIIYYNLESTENQELFSQVADKYSLLKGTPITLIGDTLIQGFANEETTGEVYLGLINNAPENQLRFEDVFDNEAQVATGLALDTVCTEESCIVDESSFSYNVTIPIIGKTIDVGQYSLAGISLVLGFVDGFNPCAMWVLIMFLFILTQIGDRKKMFLYAGIFILAEAIMYFMILTVWFTAWDFIALNHIVTPLVGVLAIASGCYFLYKYYTYTPACSVASLKTQEKISNKIKELANKKFSISVFFGILFIAFSVNIFEFACSIGIPQTFTKIIEINALTTPETLWYMFLYILMYMVDDIIVFGIALYSIEKIGAAHKYSKWSSLIGGILMLLLGLLMILAPELLVF